MIDESTLRNVESAVRSNGYGYISQYEYNCIIEAAQYPGTTGDRARDVLRIHNDRVDNGDYNYLPDPFRGVYSRRKDIEDKYD